MSTEMIDELASVMRDTVEGVQRQFDEPDDDWIPMMGLVPQDGENVMLAIDADWLANDQSKDELVDKVMLPAIDGVGAKTIATMFSAWMSVLPEDTKIEEMVRPSEDPDRVEAIVLTVMDSFKIKTWVVEIDRADGCPPALKEWNEMPVNGFSGRFVDDVQEALRDSSGETNPEFMKHLSTQTEEIIGDILGSESDE